MSSTLQMQKVTSPAGIIEANPPAFTWLSSVEVRRRLRISGCELMHLRESGALIAERHGRAFLYREDGVEMVKKTLR